MTKSQSAMEYLMTYGWAILIIAVILGALYQVGVFNPYTFSPKVAAGSCKIARGIVDGQVTSSKVGTCNNALPQFVATFNGLTGTNISTSSYLPAISAATVVGWVYMPQTSPGGDLTYLTADACGPYWNIVSSPPQSVFTSTWYVGSCTPAVATYYASLNNIPTVTWVMIAYTIDGSGNTYSYAFASGKQVSSGSTTGANAFTIPSTNWFAGNFGPGWGGTFNGELANLQLYNTTLSSNALLSLYKEGIGGAPIDAQHTVLWWPLNGDTKDYSGNGHDGKIFGGVTFTGSWTNGYTAP